ncbi:hypothetical protein Xsto_01834 [Xenorhabdus stockiae]|uniref:Uncharacterized protein n=1 Tax=Xenorhabdus stockiae TaxID=351614 RepID=A0A2D0KQI1_9GAMM|nr:hypothetical protein [Xenorhabdus stockiae]PHM65682.1 hypothetical protein Xsto_01834 [Xenorhabdus stockiae]
MLLDPKAYTGRGGGLFQEIDSDGNEIMYFVVVGDNRLMPQTSQPGHKWKSINELPAGESIQYYDE